MIGAVGAWAVLDTVRSMYDPRGEGVRYCDKAVLLLSVSLQWDGRVQCQSVVSLIKVVAGRQRFGSG
jgi:hypothetical protein